MNAKRVAGAILFVGALLWAAPRASAQTGGGQIVRLAELEIDPAQLEAYKAALREGIETAIRVEPGVLTLYAVALKDHPTHIRLFERYASAEAYQSHLGSPHFLRYKRVTAGMVRSLTLIETTPVLLGEKPAFSATSIP